MVLSEKEVTLFQEKIFAWWKNHARDLPWRHTHDTYKILVSEMMLQQTQVARVIPVYELFLQSFPTIASLASASTADVLRAWKGMGYNRRALYLQNIAKIITQKYEGVFPQNEKILLTLPGIGAYTVRAILVFSFLEDVAMVDTNIRQIITHYFLDGKDATVKEIQTIADQLVPKGKSWEWHQALMDYGSLAMVSIKTKRNNSIVKKKSIPFRETNRFFRGRIVDQLREGKRNKQELIKEVMQMYEATADKVGMILEGLEKDQLIMIRDADVSLPE